jgi:HSP20 family protein
MSITKFSPFSTLNEFPVSFRLLEDTLNRLATEGEGNARPWIPAVDILEDENQLVLRADVPGVDLSKIDIRLENGTLTLKGQREFERKDDKTSYHRVERQYGQFARSFTMPETVDPEKVGAEYKNGVLQITLGKKELAKPRSIQVQVS